MLNFLFRLIFIIPAIIIFVILAISNSNYVVFNIDPTEYFFPSPFVEIPLFFLMFACLFVGVLLGGFVTWITRFKK
jgi:uncharacterized integral membrane protein